MCLKMGLYTVLKPCLKGENTNITKNDLKFSSRNQCRRLFCPSPDDCEWIFGDGTENIEDCASKIGRRKRERT